MLQSCELSQYAKTADLWRAVPNTPMCAPRALNQTFQDGIKAVVGLAKSIPTPVYLLAIPANLLLGFIVHDIISSKRNTHRSNHSESSSSWSWGYSGSNNWYQTPLTWSIPRVPTRHISTATQYATDAVRTGAAIGRQLPGTDIYHNGIRP
ncbi:MAG: hypothetical protein Q8K75_11195 [Chlamydiales bacterium]|nr:hypothetical protein [Chlamydiales bacterium]